MKVDYWATDCHEVYPDDPELGDVSAREEPRVKARPLGGMDDGYTVAINIITEDFDTEIVLTPDDVKEIALLSRQALKTQAERLLAVSNA